MKDRGGRRQTIDRRMYSPSDHFPERRAIRFRRSGQDRRRRPGVPLTAALERRRMFRDGVEDVA